jgi:poly(3-hydroxybutyrate) depolymerase
MRNLMVFIALCLWLIPLSSEGATWVQRSVQTNQGALAFELFAPETTQVSRPLLLVLHGCAQTANELVRFGNLAAAASEASVVIAAPQVPDGGAYVGCWSYYGADHQRDAGHPALLLGLIDELVGESSLKIDPARVWVSGLSSGAGMAMVLGCLAPDKVSGVGLVASPALGSLASELPAPREGVNRVELCQSLAGSQRGALKKLRVSLLWAPNDLVLSPAYGPLNREFYRELLGADSIPLGELKITDRELPGDRPRGSEQWFGQDAQYPQLITYEHQGLGHRWPAGQGGRPQGYIARSSLDYTTYLVRFLLGN